MLFTYKHPGPHDMEKIQQYVDYIFHEVWCRAPEGEPFGTDLFNGCMDLQALFQKKCKNAFCSRVEDIYDIFANLTANDILTLKRWYTANNDIQSACAGHLHNDLCRYIDLKTKIPALLKPLKTFYKKIYEEYIKCKYLSEIACSPNKYYQDLVRNNSDRKCPFCGLMNLSKGKAFRRNAFEHYLPKSSYPFNSINTWNLIPICTLCNDEKLAKDPLKASGKLGRPRKAFYPYANTSKKPHIDIIIKVKKNSHWPLDEEDLELEYGPTSFAEEIQTWRELYKIDARYKEQCCHNDVIKELDKIRKSQTASKHSTLSWVKDEAPLKIREFQEKYVKDPLANCNFLKKAFLEGCIAAGLIPS